MEGGAIHFLELKLNKKLIWLICAVHPSYIKCIVLFSSMTSLSLLSFIYLTTFLLDIVVHSFIFIFHFIFKSSDEDQCNVILFYSTESWYNVSMLKIVFFYSIVFCPSVKTSFVESSEVHCELGPVGFPLSCNFFIFRHEIQLIIFFVHVILLIFYHARF